MHYSAIDLTCATDSEPEILAFQPKKPPRPHDSDKNASFGPNGPHCQPDGEPRQSPVTAVSSPESPYRHTPQSPGPPIDLSLLSLPPVYIIPQRLSAQQLSDLREQLEAANGEVVDDGHVHEARFLLGRIHTPKRAAFELRKCGIYTEEIDDGPTREAVWQDSSLITVVKLEWWEKCLEKDAIQSINPYIIYVGRQTETLHSSPAGKKRSHLSATELIQERDLKRNRIMERARQDAKTSDSRIKARKNLADVECRRLTSALGGSGEALD
jgi:hypothetical protein